jgi:hypothetical protein
MGELKRPGKRRGVKEGDSVFSVQCEGRGARAEYF